MTIHSADPPGVMIPPISSTTASVGAGDSPSTLAIEHAARVKLPKLALKRFNGDLTKWATFWDSFDSSIHNNPGLSGIDKFNYLNTLLEGPAAEAISGLKLTAANYNEAVAILKRRFGNKQLIITKHMDVLLNIDAVTSPHNLKGLRHLYDVVESQVRGLRSLGVPAESYGSLLSSVLLNKLPQDLRLVVSRQVSEEEWTLDGLMGVIEREIMARERAAGSSCQVPRRVPREPNAATALFTGNLMTPKCSYCRQSHSSNSCRTIVDVAERKQILRRAGRCFICLKKNHMSRDCRSTMKCTKCNGRHHVSICSESQVRNSPAPSRNEGNQNAQGSAPPNQPSRPINTTAPVPVSTTMYCVEIKIPVLLQTAKTIVYNIDDPKRTKEVRIIFDSGSQRSYITDKVREQLSLGSINAETMLIKTFGSENHTRQTCDVVKLGINLRDGSNMQMSFLSVPLICEPLSNQPIALAASSWNRLAPLQLADYSQGDVPLEIDILIGSDQYWKLVTGEMINQCNGPTAVRTLGWVLSGPVEGLSQPESSVNLVSTHVLMVDDYQPPVGKQGLDHQLKKFWDLECMGIKSGESSVYNEFESKILFKDCRYMVSLPWKHSHQSLPSNYELALRRLNGLLQRLKQNPNILNQYDSVIRDQLNRGIVEMVDQPERKPANQTHYLPHHAVIREDKTTTKLRVVYDASSKTNGPSLNDCLYTGPKSGQSIMEIILRFRAFNVALAADIEKAFLMIGITPQDRDVLRFLWIDDIKSMVPKIEVFRFTRVVFGVSSSPFLLNATIRHHVERYSDAYPNFVDTFLRSIYVDDVSYGADSIDHAYELYFWSKHILAEAGFNLRKFVTNSTVLAQRIEHESASLKVTDGKADKIIEEEDKTYTKDLLGGKQGPQDNEQKILGIRWNFVLDELIFDLNELAILVNKLKPTKRQIVTVTTRFYDPLGFISPIVIRFKILFREMCKKKLGWDEPLSGELLKKWNSLKCNFQGITTSIPRNYFVLSDKSSSRCSLQGFCDASIDAYAAVVYLKIENKVGTTINFVASKTRVAPTSKQTIPRLELLSALLLAKLITSVAKALEPVIEIQEIRCFSDSKVSLYWIMGETKEWKPFVENRVIEVRKLVPSLCWEHCPGKDNPADLPSRGITPTELAGSKLWRYGPNWLIHKQPHEEEDAIEMPDECLREIKVSHHPIHNLIVTNNHSCRNGVGAVMSCEDYGSLQKLLRITAYVMRFIDALKQAIERRIVTSTSELTASELARAERLWIIESQKCLEVDKHFLIWQRQFGLYLEDKVWRCKGRLGNTDLPYSAKYPILLHKSYHLSLLIVRDAHNRVMHDGVKETLTEIRSKYWIIRGRQLVRMVLQRCVICRRFEGLPFNPPPPPPLPDFRVREQPAFTYAGVDFAGPLYTRDKVANKSKVWICLYTCCAIRAVHLELVPDMTTEAFIRSFKRFTARRGFPRKLISDNGKTFKSAAKSIEATLNHPEVQQYFAGIGMEWSFNLEKAPWWGGVFERMVKSVKRCLRKTIGRAKLCYDELLTALTEVEMIVNSRPLSYISADDTEEPLTPSHLLVGRRTLSLPDVTFQHEMDEDNYKVEITPDTLLSRRMSHLRKTLDHFWKRWQAEYLLQLRDCHRHYKKTDERGDTLSEGQIVLVHSEKCSRGFWKLAKIHQLIQGSDGHVRGAVIRLPGRGNQTKLLRRPLQCLYPLELDHVSCDNKEEGAKETKDSTHDDEEESNHLNEAQPEALRPARRAAQKANDFIKAVMETESDSET